MINECFGKYFFCDDDIVESKKFDSDILNRGKVLYDVIRIVDKVPLFIEKYLKRINKSAKLENLEIWLSEDIILEKIGKIIEINDIETGSLKIAFSYGNDYFGDSKNIFFAYFIFNNPPNQQQFTDGVATLTLKAERNKPHAKIFNRNLRETTLDLMNKNFVYEIILVDREENITEGSKSNIFFIRKDKVYTTLVDRVLPGITRENTIDICKSSNIEIEETIIPKNTLEDYESVFLTGTSRRVLPINKIDNYNYDVNHKILRKIQSLYNIEIENYIKTVKNKLL